VVEEGTHSMVYSNIVLPSLFHGWPGEFIITLSRYGTSFLREAWDQAAKKVGEARRCSPFGLNYEIRERKPYISIALITLPKPKVEHEAYFAGLIHRPLRRTPFIGIADTTKVINLEHARDTNGREVTLLREWTRYLKPQGLGPGPLPRLEDFYQALLHILSES
jgi:hypothetical protein